MLLLPNYLRLVVLVAQWLGRLIYIKSSWVRLQARAESSHLAQLSLLSFQGR